LERAVRSHGKKRDSGKGKSNSTTSGDNRVIAEWEEKLRHRFGTAVEINRKASNKGRVEIEFYSDDDLERVLDLLLPG